MVLREGYTPKILAEMAFVVVAERSKAPDHFRSFGQKLRWVRGWNFFSFFFKIWFDATFRFYTIFQALSNFPNENYGRFPKNGTSL